MNLYEFIIELNRLAKDNYDAAKAEEDSGLQEFHRGQMVTLDLLATMIKHAQAQGRPLVGNPLLGMINELKTYAMHFPTCAMKRTEQQVCDCGLSKLLKELPE